MSDAQTPLIAVPALLTHAYHPDPFSQLDDLWHYACVGSPLLLNPVVPAQFPAFDESTGCRRHLLRRVFHCFDQNRDGLVGTSEISRILGAFGISQNEEGALMAGFATKLTGHADEHEFCLLYDSVRSTLSVSYGVDVEDDRCLLEAFQVFDNDGDGFISPRELQRVLRSLGFGVASQLEACVEMIARVDENADGLVDFLEFKRLFRMEVDSHLIAVA